MTEIDIFNLYKEIKGNIVLHNITMKLCAGHIYGVRGQNGCGKTMLLRTICGLVIPSSGRILIDGKELHQDIDIPESIGALIEAPAFLPDYSGYKNLKMLASITGGISEIEIKKALSSVGLDPTDKREYRRYSLGMKQKLGIANAIMGEPNIILLDEPINALDQESVDMVKQTLHKLKERNKLIVVVCHDKEELEYLCDIIYEMKEGTLAGVSGKIENDKFVYERF